jgi:hypothetical protein
MEKVDGRKRNRIEILTDELSRYMDCVNCVFAFESYIYYQQIRSFENCILSVHLFSIHVHLPIDTALSTYFPPHSRFGSPN